MTDREIAQAALVLCAEVLRQFRWEDPIAAGAGTNMIHTGWVPVDEVRAWSEQVLAWQDQLDDTEPDPELPPPPPPAAGDLVIISHNGRAWQHISTGTDPEPIVLTPSGPGPGWTEIA